MKHFAALLLTIGLATIPARAEETSPEALDATRGFDDPPRGYATDSDPTNDTLPNAGFFSFARTNVVTGRGVLSPNDVDYWGVALTAGQTLLVITTPLDNLPNGYAVPDTIVDIRSSGDAVYISNDDAGRDFPAGLLRGSVVRFRAPSSGTYYIRVSGYNDSQTGNYAIHFATVGWNEGEWIESYNDAPVYADIIPIAESGPTTGNLGTENPGVDYCGFDLNAHDILIVSASALGNLPADWSRPDLNMTIYALDGSTELLYTSRDSGGDYPGVAEANGSVTARFRAPATGRYFIRIGEDSPSASLYTLFTARIPASVCPGDADGNGTVNFTDISTVLANFGNICP